jgi:hypothetical protein
MNPERSIRAWNLNCGRDISTEAVVMVLLRDIYELSLNLKRPAGLICGNRILVPECAVTFWDGHQRTKRQMLLAEGSVVMIKAEGEPLAGLTRMDGAACELDLTEEI